MLRSQSIAFATTKAMSACLFLAIALGLLGSCATHHTASATPKPGSGVDEYRHLTTVTAAAVLDALRWLEQLSAHTNQCETKLVAAFAERIERLQVESIQVRARAQAIQARGDAYFQAWAHGGTVNGLQIPPTPRNLPQLQENYARLKTTSLEARDAFRPFFAGLRSLRVELEANPAALQNENTRLLIRTTREYGCQALQKLGALRDELDTVRPLIIKAVTQP